ncbi:hypothetical protein DL768_011162 [Monosporascus sp. mg162]|nr:hypothetical protein DL768_011162 [Monosporascus sp. mg162]
MLAHPNRKLKTWQCPEAPEALEALEALEPWKQPLKQGYYAAKASQAEAHDDKKGRYGSREGDEAALQEKDSTGAGKARTEKRSDAGQPVHDHQPDSPAPDPAGREDEDTENDSDGEDAQKYKVDGEPVGRTEEDEPRKEIETRPAATLVGQDLSKTLRTARRVSLPAIAFRYRHPGGSPGIAASAPATWVSTGTAVGTQSVASAVMMIAAFRLGDDQSNPPGAGMHAFILSMLQTTLKFCLRYNTGSWLNPASDLGPRLVAYLVGYSAPEIFSGPWWIYGPWAAVFAGSLVGCICCDSMIIFGSEFPINYRVPKASRNRFNHV